MTQEPRLTFEQAYRAMYYFLENEYRLTKSDELGGILSSLSWHIWQDRSPGDPAAWEEWLDAVNTAITTDDPVLPHANNK